MPHLSQPDSRAPRAAGTGFIGRRRTCAGTSEPLRLCVSARTMKAFEFLATREKENGFPLRGTWREAAEPAAALRVSARILPCRASVSALRGG